MSTTYTLQNQHLKVSIAAKGAELQSIESTITGLQYLWNGDAHFWGKKSPVLFPIVGGLKNNQYTHNNQTYTLHRHGFARDQVFEVVQQTDSSITLQITDSAATHEVYPFQFSFHIRYTLEENQVVIQYLVHNLGSEPMYFSVGAHPAFQVPLTNDTAFEDYYLKFRQPETAGIWPLNNDGLLATEDVPFLKESDTLPLTKSLFYKDALVFKSLQSNAISIISNKTTHGLTVAYTNFPFMGIWSAKNAPFVCIEPWCGIADSANTTGELKAKEGIHELDAHAVFERSWSITVF